MEDNVAALYSFPLFVGARGVRHVQHGKLIVGRSFHLPSQLMRFFVLGWVSNGRIWLAMQVGIHQRIFLSPSLFGLELSWCVLYIILGLLLTLVIIFYVTPTGNDAYTTAGCTTEHALHCGLGLIYALPKHLLSWLTRWAGSALMLGSYFLKVYQLQASWIIVTLGRALPHTTKAGYDSILIFFFCTLCHRHRYIYDLVQALFPHRH